MTDFKGMMVGFLQEQITFYQDVSRNGINVNRYKMAAKNLRHLKL